MSTEQLPAVPGDTNTPTPSPTPTLRRRPTPSQPELATPTVYGQAAIVMFVAMVAMLGIALYQRHTDGNPMPYVYAAIAAMAASVMLAGLHDYRTELHRRHGR